MKKGRIRALFCYGKLLFTRWDTRLGPLVLRGLSAPQGGDWGSFVSKHFNSLSQKSVECPIFASSLKTREPRYAPLCGAVAPPGATQLQR
jgi:hypothetical protein